MVKEMTSRPILFMSVGAGGAHAVAHHLGFLHDLFHRKLADDAAQVAFHHKADQRLAVLVGLGEELFGRCLDGFRVGLDFDLRHGFDGYGDALHRVEVLLRGNVERHQFERELARGFEHG